MFLISISPIWISLGPLIVITSGMLASLFYFLWTRKGRPVPEEVQTRPNSKWLSGILKHWWYWTNDPIAKFFVRIGATPNILTFLGFLVSGGAAFLFAKGYFGYAGWLLALSGTFDLFDGHVARITGKVSKSGAFFDAVMDRFGEGALFLGLSFYFHDSWLLFFVILGLIGSMSVSYARAKGESVGIVVKEGSMQRPERLAYMSVASIFQPITTYGLQWVWPTSFPILIAAAIILIGVMTNLTAAFRIVYVMNKLDTLEKRKETKTVPQFLSELTTVEGRKNLVNEFHLKRITKS